MNCSLDLAESLLVCILGGKTNMVLELANSAFLDFCLFVFNSLDQVVFISFLTVFA